VGLSPSAFDIAEATPAGRFATPGAATESALRQLVTRGFFLPVEPEKDGQTVLHSEKFVLVDQQGRIRGYYDSEASDSQDQVLADVQRLLAAES
jgi:protein SCO1/2